MVYLDHSAFSPICLGRHNSQPSLRTRKRCSDPAVATATPDCRTQAAACASTAPLAETDLSSTGGLVAAARKGWAGQVTGGVALVSTSDLT